jgi:N-acetylneuraminic acid mutarotase
MKASKVVFLVFLILMSLCVVNTQPVKAAEATENTWTSRAPMPGAVIDAMAVVLNGRIYVVGRKFTTAQGGWVVLGSTVTYEYDPATDVWVTKKPMPTQRSDFAVAACQNKIYVIGGETGSNENGMPYLCELNEVYDPATDTWENRTVIPSPRIGIRANVVNGKIYVIGGNNDGAYSSQFVNEVYDPANDSWTTKAPLPHAVFGYASAVLDNKIYVISGQSDNRADPGPIDRGLTQIYNAENDTWSQGATIPTKVFVAAAGATTGLWAPKRIYVLGGSVGFLEISSSNQVYDPEKDTWTTGTPMPTARNGEVAVVNDMLYAIGGSTGAFQPISAQIDQYTPFGFGTVPPAISIVSPENKTYTVSNVSLTFAVDKPVSWMGYSLDKQANVTVIGNITLTDMPNGYHNLTVYANDTSGNMGASETMYFTVALPSEPFPTTWIAAAIVMIAIGAVAFLVYFRRIRKTTGKANQVKEATNNTS